MKQVEACKLTDTVRDPSDQLSGRDDVASETQFPLFNLHWGGGRGRIAAIGEAAWNVCLQRKDFNRGRQPGLCASASLEFWCCAKIESTHAVLKCLGGEMRVGKTATQLVGVLKSRKTLVAFVHSQRLSNTFRLNPSLPLIFLA